MWNTNVDIKSISKLLRKRMRRKNVQSPHFSATRKMGHLSCNFNKAQQFHDKTSCNKYFKFNDWKS